MHLTSPAFHDGAEIPAQYTCEGKDVSPPLAWTGVPAKAKSLALIVDDPDAPDPAAPQRTWVHWVVYNLPAEPSALDATLPRLGQPTKQQLEAAMKPHVVAQTQLVGTYQKRK